MFQNNKSTALRAILDPTFQVGSFASWQVKNEVIETGISNLAPGEYNVTLSTELGVNTLKVIINR